MSNWDMEVMSIKPFDLRRERRAMYRYWKRYPTSLQDKRAAGLQSVRQFHAVLNEQYGAYMDMWALEVAGEDCP